MAPPQWAYQVENFVNDPDEELICSICCSVFCDPVMCACDHVFCQVCITKWVQNSRNCPICRKQVSPSSARQMVLIVRNIIMKLMINCRNKTLGCTAQFSVESSEAHIKECEYELVQCKNKPCKEKLFRTDIAEHEASDCSHRFVKSRKCRSKMPQPMPENHALQLRLRSAGQADHNQLWVEYYRCLGMFREADMIEQQSLGGQAPGPQTGNPVNNPGAPLSNPGIAPQVTTGATQPAPVAAAGYPRAYLISGQQPQPAQVPYGQPAFSPEMDSVTLGACQAWAGYYRSLGMFREADMIEQQSLGGQAPGAQMGNPVNHPGATPAAPVATTGYLGAYLTPGQPQPAQVPYCQPAPYPGYNYAATYGSQQQFHAAAPQQKLYSWF